MGRGRATITAAATGPPGIETGNTPIVIIGTPTRGLYCRGVERSLRVCIGWYGSPVLCCILRCGALGQESSLETSEPLPKVPRIVACK